MSGDPAPPTGRFRFQPRWKEELLIVAEGGSLVLDHPMGAPAVHLPAEAVWPRLAPAWAAPLWPALRAELGAWCATHGVRLVLDEGEGARVWPVGGGGDGP